MFMIGRYDNQYLFFLDGNKTQKQGRSGKRKHSIFMPNTLLCVLVNDVYLSSSSLDVIYFFTF